MGLDLPLASLIGIVGKRKKFLTCKQEQSLSDYAQQELSNVIKKPPLDMQRL
jgi:hypothetical protein